jgi:peptidoglycan hydrolase-like protein with peptidoglycan-binding domain
LRFPTWKLFIISVLAYALAGVSQAQTTAPKPAASPSAAKKPASANGKTASRKKGKGSRRGAWKRKGQQVIKPERVTEIQEALIREKYLTGEPSGKWDARTQAAMTRYQADNGWQSKVTPDSRALIKLGLGPNYSQALLNAPTKNGAVAANTSGESASSADPKR